MKTLTSALTVLMLLITVSAFAQPGSPDSSFGTNGKRVKPAGKGYAMAIQTDGKIVMAGSRRTNGNWYNLMLARYLSNGSIDKSFGNKGSTVMDFGGYSKAFSIAIQADGKIVAAGTALKDFAIARFNPDGRPDSSFGINGKVTTDFAGYGSRREVNFVAIQPDNKIIVIGTVYHDGDLSSIALARYNADGSLDTGFGNGGGLIAHIAGDFDEGYAVILQPGGKIVAIGYAYMGVIDHDPQEFVLIRYNANGNIDSSFGTNGYTFTNIHNFDFPTAAAVQTNGKIVVAGYSMDDSYFVFTIALARYTKDGLPDSSFGTNGTVITSVGRIDDRAYGLTIQPDNKIVVAGSTSDSTGEDLFVARFPPKGKFDKTFGVNGIVITDFGRNDVARSVALQADGKIVAAGSSGKDLALARYNGDNAVFNNVSNENISSLKNTEGSLSANEINIYPNPIESILNIEFNKTGTVQKRISIYDVSGKLFITKSAEGNTQIDVKRLIAGTYLIKITDASGKLLYSGKVIKQ